MGEATDGLKVQVSRFKGKEIMKVKRTFHPVGQGAFYTETFLDYRYPIGMVVYDCGVSGGSAHLITCLDEQFNRYGRNIDLLFVSHFHADHISYIPYLLKNCHVKAIVLPVITPTVAMDAYLNNYIEAGTLNSDTLTFLDNIFGEQPRLEGTKIVFVYSLSEGNNKPREDGEFLDLKNIQANVDTINSERSLRLYEWEYILCNYPCANSSVLEDKMRKKYPELLDAMQKRKWNEVRTLLGKIPFKDIAQLYKNCFKKNENEESMTVLSKPLSNDYPPASSCLYTGDSPFRNSSRLKYVKNYYSNYWKEIGTLQSPHHGADDDNPEELYDFHRTCVACYGTGNSYGHPGRQALINMATSRSNIRLVTESPNSVFLQYISC